VRQAHSETGDGRRGRGFVERHRFWLTLGFVVGACVVTLFPGRLPWVNGIRWAEPGPGLHFKSIAQALSEAPIVSRSGEFSVEIYLKSGFQPGVKNQEILSFYDDEIIRPLVIGQFPRGFLLRGRADNPGGDARDDAYIGIDEVGLARPENLRHLAVNVGEKGARLFVNGRPSALELPRTIARLGEPFGGHLMLGSSNTGWRVWLGTMRGVVIRDRVLGEAELWDHAVRPGTLGEAGLERDEHVLALYRFEEGVGRRTSSSKAGAPDLFFPDRMMRPTRPNFLSFYTFDPGDQRWLPQDIGFNILFFLPLGFLLAWRRGPRMIRVALAAGFALSLGIEVAQSFVPGRSSSLIDLASNSAGALLGALLTRLPRWVRALF